MSDMSNRPNEFNPGIGRAGFLAGFIAVLCAVYFIPVLHQFILNLSQGRLPIFGINWALVATAPTVFNLIVIFVVNLSISLLLVPIFYFRIINIKLSVNSLLLLAVPFISILLLVRCLVYQKGYTQTGQLDDIGKLNIKILNVIILGGVLLVTTYLLADYI